MRGPLALLIASLTWVAACGPSSRTASDGGAGDVDAPTPACSDGNHRCNVTTYEVCTGGQWATQQDCAVACSETLGCVECNPGANVCSAGNVHQCTPAGEVGGEVTVCADATVCQNGACVDACADAAMQRSYTGCEYWAVDLDNAVEILGAPSFFGCSFDAPGSKEVNRLVCSDGNGGVVGACDPPANGCPTGYTCQAEDVCILDAQRAPFAIVVSNPQARAVTVTVTGPGGETIVRAVAAGQVLPIVPQPTGMAPLIPDQSIDGTGTARKAYKVTSDLPIIAYQFNPLDNVDVFSNDASLLVPRAAFDTDYYVMTSANLDRRATTFPEDSKDRYHGYASIVAWQDGTTIEVTPTVAIEASATQPAIAANTPTMFTLGAFDVLTLQAAGAGDLTGTRVRAINANIPFGVFGGHEAAAFGETTPPSQATPSGPCCADHLEEMMFPTSTWGKTFALARSQSRGAMEPDRVRIMAQKPGTTLQFLPPPAAGTCGTLAAGQFCDVKIQVDTSIIASEPVLVAHYLQSALWFDPFGFADPVGEGDPSMAISVPVEQYRTDYAVLVPAQYPKNFLSISAPGTGAVLVDGTAATLTGFANGTYRAARIPVTAGQHRIQCPTGCGVEVYGYGDAVSYMFAGGLDLKQIVIQ